MLLKHTLDIFYARFGDLGCFTLRHCAVLRALSLRSVKRFKQADSLAKHGWLRGVVLVGLLATTQASFAIECEGTGWQALIAERSPSTNDFVEPACALLPDGSDHGVLAWVRPSAPESPASEADESQLDLHVLLFNASTQAVLAYRQERRDIVSDAFELAELRIDTARYDLAPGLRAFGVRTRHRNHSRPNPASEEALSLYVFEAGQLRRVLPWQQMALFSGEWDMNCAGTFIDRKAVIQLGSESKKVPEHGWTDLLLVNTEKTETAQPQGDDCINTQSRPVRTRTRLRYDGQVYRAASP